ncbi:hypothetical protein [Leucobacter iarius]|uniref:Uncharacterized protein n=1 Tax=Leucobacter iarius TaxID=333963 RepID=A0ABP4XSW1_9MICO
MTDHAGGTTDTQPEMVRTVSAPVVARVAFVGVSVVLAIVGWMIASAQISTVRDNGGGTLDLFPAELMSFTLGLALMLTGLLMLTVWGAVELARLLRRSSV